MTQHSCITLPLSDPLSHLPVTAPGGRRAVMFLKAGPVWESDGRLVALEWLADIRDRCTGEQIPAEAFFARTPDTELLHILAWQLQVLASFSPWCRSHGLKVSLNLTRSQAISVLATPSVTRQITRLRDILRLELSEFFVQGGPGAGTDTLVQAMAELTPLWLDDFGCGTTPYVCLTEGRFEVVKIDRSFMVRLQQMAGGASFLRGLNTLVAGTGNRLIAEGIADPALWAFACASGVSACQGWLWPEVSVSDLCGLPGQLPGRQSAVLPDNRGISAFLPQTGIFR